MVLSGLVIYFLRDFIIQVLFTSEFNNMRDLFSFQLSSDIIKMASWILGYILIARAMTREYIIMEILHCSLFVLFSWLFIPYFGAKGAIFGYLASQIFYFFTIAFILRNIFFSTKTNFKK
jgi:PST family polysaccharide transporter